MICTGHIQIVDVLGIVRYMRSHAGCSTVSLVPRVPSAWLHVSPH